MEELVDDYQDQWDKEKVTLILDRACNDGRAGRTIERMWAAKILVIHES